MNEEEFEQKLEEIYFELLKNQELIGPEFERIWNENIDELYNNDIDKDDKM